jgi:hypothetical protein
VRRHVGARPAQGIRRRQRAATLIACVRMIDAA